ncbi:MAG: hypothetical protein M1404_05235 [Acidobacteria bacterium]|nr:hypothetical protein [Acidobacteriota bacterium]
MRGVLSTAILVLATAFPAGAHTRPRFEPRRRRAPTETLAPYSPSPRGLYHPRMTWYEFMVHQLNPHDRDYGAWYRERRAALVDASIRNQYFWYAFWATVALMFVVPWLIKSLYDSRKKERIMDDMMEKVRAHDASSRQAAHEAIKRYNNHIELCNRVIEAQQAGQPAGTTAGSQPNEAHANPERTQTELEDLKRDKARLQAEIQQRQADIPELSKRIDALRDKTGHNGNSQPSPNASAITDPGALRQINELQQQLRYERDQNKRLKGGR